MEGLREWGERYSGWEGGGGLARFDEHFISKCKIVHVKACFHQKVQSLGESLEYSPRDVFDMAKNVIWETKGRSMSETKVVISMLNYQRDSACRESSYIVQQKWQAKSLEIRMDNRIYQETSGEGL